MRGFWDVVTSVVEAFTDMEVNGVFNVGRKSVYAVSSNLDKFGWLIRVEGSV
jgi:predicted transcriptional regulator of viral defense system